MFSLSVKSSRDTLLAIGVTFIFAFSDPGGMETGKEYGKRICTL